MATQLVPLQDVEQLSPMVIRILGGNPGKVPYPCDLSRNQVADRLMPEQRA